MTLAWGLQGRWVGTHAAVLGGAMADRLCRGAAGLWRQWCELRIDVDLPADDLEDELAKLYARWFLSDAKLDDLDAGPSLHGLVFKTRQADGEQFIYVVDPARRVLAAYIVFSRLVEVNRRADKHLRSPHAKVAQAYRRLGITSRVYRWWLDAGRNLMSGERQSPHAHQMWMSLAKDYELAYVRVQDKQILPVDADAPESVVRRLGTRMVLLGRGCDASPFSAARGSFRRDSLWPGRLAPEPQLVDGVALRARIDGQKTGTGPTERFT